jgi:hypothetical protein
VASSSAPFVVVEPAEGTGNGNVQITVQANSADARVAQVTLGGHILEVRQAAPPPSAPGCTFTVTPEQLTAAASGETLNVDVRAAASCEWTTTSSASFVVVGSSAPRTGDGNVAIQVASNPGRARTGSLTVAGKLVTVAQAASTSCVAAISASPVDYAAAGGSGKVDITAPAECDWSLTASDAFATVSGGAAGSGTQTRDVVVAANSSATGRALQIAAGGKSVTLNQAGTTGAPAPTPPPADPAPPAPPPAPPTPPPTPPPPPLPPPPGPSETSRFTYVSPAGEYVGGGNSGALTSAGTLFSLISDPIGSNIQILMGTGSNQWRALFTGPGGQPLSPGVYENVARAPFAGANPGLSISSPGRACNQISGRFEVHEMQPGPLGVKKFHATFSQLCEGGPPALTGEVVYVAPGPALPPPQLSSSVSGFRFTSESGDSVGAGGSGTVSASQGMFEGSVGENGRTVTGEIAGTNGAPLWRFRFGAPAGQVLTPGLYTDASTSGLFAGQAAGISVSSSTGCNEATGAFHIHAIEFGPLRTIKKLHATFEQRCQASAAALRGEVVIALVPYAPPAPTPSPSSSLLRIVSEPGDWVGQGTTENWTAANATFLAAVSGSGVEAVMMPNGDPSWRWKLTISYNSQPPPPGLYEMVEGQQTVGPSFAFHLPARGCVSNARTTFQVHQLAIQAGAITRLQVTFEQRCGTGRPSLRGEFVVINP